MSTPFVTDEEVRAIIDTTVEDISAFIVSAHALVEQVLGSSETAINKEIERWLSAHFIAIRDPRLKSQEIDDAKETYAISTGTGALASTPYGQQVLILDATGAFAQLSKRKASFSVIKEDYGE